eukprot:1810185-Alexandrium_andersonii.AAC.1
MPLVASVERDRSCQLELGVAPTPPHHQYCDINEFWERSVWATIQDLKRMGSTLSFRALLPVVLTRKA